MKIIVLIHDDLSDEASAALERFVEAMARAGCSVTVQGDPPPQPEKTWEIAADGLASANVDPPAISYDRGGQIVTRMGTETQAKWPKGTFTNDNAPAERLEVCGTVKLPR